MVKNENRTDKDFNKWFKKVYKVNDAFIRRFSHILNNKEQSSLFNEYLYIRDIYDIDDNILLDCLINKYIKQKFHHIIFQDITKKYLI